MYVGNGNNKAMLPTYLFVTCCKIAKNEYIFLTHTFYRFFYMVTCINFSYMVQYIREFLKIEGNIC